RAGVESCNMQPARAHCLDLCGIRLYRKEDHLLSGDLLHMLNEAVPNLCVDGGVFDWCVGKDKCRGIDQLFRIGRRIGDEIAVAIAVSLVEISARTFLRVSQSEHAAGNECSKKAHDEFDLLCQGQPPSVSYP